MLPEIDLLIVSRDSAPYLDRLLASIAEQRYPLGLIRALVIDDASSDNTSQVVESWQRRNEFRIDFSVNATRQSMNKSRNAAVAASSADYVLFADADSLLTPHALEKLASALVEDTDPETGFSYSNYMLLGESNPGAPDYRVAWQPVRLESFDRLTDESINWIAPMSLLKRSALPKEGLDETVDDYDRSLIVDMMIDAGWCGVLVPEELFYIYGFVAPPELSGVAEA